MPKQPHKSQENSNGDDSLDFSPTPDDASLQKQQEAFDRDFPPEERLKVFEKLLELEDAKAEKGTATPSSQTKKK